MAARLLGAAAFTIQAAWRAARARPDVIVVSTSPPFAAAAALVAARLTGARLVHWVMDLNPDQAIAMGVVARGSLPARALDALNRLVLRRAAAVVVLDRFMAERVRAKHDVGARLSVIPPWPHEAHLGGPDADGGRAAGAAGDAFRAAHGLTGKFVVMYSGNHTHANPLDTLLAAAERMRDDPDVAFVFVGGGAAKARVEAVRARAPGVVSLPYQPMDSLGESLAAADVHVVTMGDRLAGIVHPCKVYGAMAVARPVLLFGPAASHVNDLIVEHGVGWRAAHDDVDGAVTLVRRLRAMPRERLRARGAAARALVSAQLSQAALRGRFCDVVERAAAAPRAR
jgi:glycosyltransferase involved in cell wall biosynthesis